MNDSKSRISSRNAGRSGTVALMQPAHGLLEFALQQKRKRIAATRDAVLDAGQLLSPGRMQHKGSHLLGQAESTRMANTHTQAPEGRARKGRLDVAQAVVPGMAATLLELHLAGQEVELVVQD